MGRDVRAIVARAVALRAEARPARPHPDRSVTRVSDARDRERGRERGRRDVHAVWPE
ncbi:hypothetical protein ACWEGQ_29690 [Streptomyces seoulensis]